MERSGAYDEHAWLWRRPPEAPRLRHRAPAPARAAGASERVVARWTAARRRRARDAIRRPDEGRAARPATSRRRASPRCPRWYHPGGRQWRVPSTPRILRSDT
ncbi:hypothetical protein QJS66_05815 [Kocuria rhizophila]|nr:hypothetical protein QJS66_05815 [Kocuria rhizophila]